MIENPPSAAAISQDLFCPACGYNLRGLAGDRCPECGDSIEGVRDPVSHIPWVHRKQLGWWRAYWKTVFFVMFKPRHFLNEMGRPVSYCDSQLFRWVTVAIVFSPFLLFAFASATMPQEPAMSESPLFNFLVSSLQGWAFVGCVLPFLCAATGAPSYFLHSRDLPIEMQNRAIALSYYACSPLVLSVIPVTTFLVVLAFRDPADELRPLLFLTAAAVGSALLIQWWLVLIRLVRANRSIRGVRTAIVGVSVPVLWATAAGVILIGIPLIPTYVSLVVRSLAE